MRSCVVLSDPTQNIIEGDAWLQVAGLLAQLLVFLRKPLFEGGNLLEASTLDHGAVLSGEEGERN
ncbi:MAG: hypothetical protein ABW006_06480 [Hyphomicrobium sp.]